MQLSDVDSLLCGVQRHVRHCSAAQLEELPVRPTSPEPWQCCGQSCRPCVFDLHRSDLHEWAVQCGSQLKAPELRELVDRVRPPSQLDLQLPNGAVWAGKRTRLRLSNVQQFTENLALYSFVLDDLPDNGPSHCRKQLVSLPICGHITLKLGGVSRQMTPLANGTDNFDVDLRLGRILLRGGVLRFLIKIYPGGQFTLRLAELRPDDTSVSASGFFPPLCGTQQLLGHTSHCDTLLAFACGTGLAPLTHLLNERTLGTECSPQLRYRIVLCVPRCDQVGLAQWQSPVETEFDWCENIDVHFSKLDETAAKIELEKCRGKVQVLACGSKSFEKDVTKWIRLVQGEHAVVLRF